MIEEMNPVVFKDGSMTGSIHNLNLLHTGFIVRNRILVGDEVSKQT
jgi:hypothetical protein